MRGTTSILFTFSKNSAQLEDMENTAKNFALQMGSLISLYISITALITLLFSVITLQFPDAANGYWEFDGASRGIRFSISMLIVFFPAYVVLTRMVNQVRRTESGMYLALTKWLLYLSLLLGGALLLGDLVFVINAFLDGEITTRFILKALVFFLVVGAAFGYYLFDARGYWQSHEKRSVGYAAVMSVVVLVSLILGFMKIEAPSVVREMRIDDRQISDLANIQSHIEAYLYTNSVAPQSIDEAFGGVAIPQAPEDRAAYEYRVTGEDTYELCAEFAHESVTDGRGMEIYRYDLSIAKGVVNWEHGAGHWCFDRKFPSDLTPVLR